MMSISDPLESEPPLLQKVAPIRIFEQAVEQIRALILNGQVKPGDRLPPEHVLCQQLNISRSTVREAMRVLESEGLIEVRRGMGAFVLQPPIPAEPRLDILNWLENHREAITMVIQVRDCIEPRAAMLAAQKKDRVRILEIQKILNEHTVLLDEFERGKEQNIYQLAKLDSDFHVAIARAGGNDLLLDIVAYVLPAFIQSNQAVLDITKRWQEIGKEHHAIFRAIEMGQPEEAQRAMRYHIKQVGSGF